MHLNQQIYNSTIVLKDLNLTEIPFHNSLQFDKTAAPYDHSLFTMKANCVNAVLFYLINTLKTVYYMHQVLHEAFVWVSMPFVYLNQLGVIITTCRFITNSWIRSKELYLGSPLFSFRASSRLTTQSVTQQLCMHNGQSHITHSASYFIHSVYD